MAQEKDRQAQAPEDAQADPLAAQGVSRARAVGSKVCVPHLPEGEMLRFAQHDRGERLSGRWQRSQDHEKPARHRWCRVHRLELCAVPAGQVPAVPGRRVDKLTYAGNPDNLKDIAEGFADRYAFVQADICDGAAVEEAVRKHAIDTIINFAAETHVDRSLVEPGAFIQTDVYGTHVLLEAAKVHGLERYHQVSTDEV